MLISLSVPSVPHECEPVLPAGYGTYIEGFLDRRRGTELDCKTSAIYPPPSARVARAMDLRRPVPPLTSTLIAAPPEASKARPLAGEPQLLGGEAGPARLRFPARARGRRA